MVDWTSYATANHNSNSWVYLGHLMNGLYLWEWIANVGFDYRLLTNSKGSRWAVAVYLSCRLSGLLMVIVSFVQFDSELHSDVAIPALFTATMAFAYIGMLLSSILIALRAIAIWNRSQYVIWPIAFAFLGYCGVTIFAAVGDPSSEMDWFPISPSYPGAFIGDLFPNSLINRVNYTYGMIFDIGTLVLALIGALRYGRSPTRGGLWMFIYHQGVIWILAVVVTYMFPVVFLWLNLNGYMNMMTMVPSALAMVTAATTMYRELYERAHSDKAVHVFKQTASGGLRLTADHGQSVVYNEDVRTDRQARDSMLFEMTVINSSPGDASLPKAEHLIHE